MHDAWVALLVGDRTGAHRGAAVGDGGDVEAVEDPEAALPGSSEARAKLQVRGSFDANAALARDDGPRRRRNSMMATSSKVPEENQVGGEH
jgi:hypothetical protein